MRRGLETQDVLEALTSTNEGWELEKDQVMDRDGHVLHLFSMYMHCACIITHELHVQQLHKNGVM